MARGYRQLKAGDTVYRQDSHLRTVEHRVSHIVLDGDEAVQVAVREVRGGTVAAPGGPSNPQVRFWSLAQIDEDATGPSHWRWRKVTDEAGGSSRHRTSTA